MMRVDSRLLENLAKVRGRIAAAAHRAGRNEAGIMLAAVTKSVDVHVAQMLIAAGCRDLGESRPQELWAKAMATRISLPEENVRWHMIGHLQRNKVRRSLPIVSLIHSVDSLPLLVEIDRQAREFQLRSSVLVEVNISGDPAKHGFSPNEIEPLLPELAKLEHVAIRGLMGMAGLEGDSRQARREFAALRELRDRAQQAAPPNVDLRELSMGMSGDFEIAIEEGATIVRIGSALFEGMRPGD